MHFGIKLLYGSFGVKLLAFCNFRSIMMERIFHYLSIWRSWNGLKRHTRCCLMLRFLLELNSTIYMGSILRHHTAFGNASIWLFCWKCSMIIFVSVTNFILQVCVSWYFYTSFDFYFLSFKILQLWKWGDTCHRYTRLTVYSGDFCFWRLL